MSWFGFVGINIDRFVVFIIILLAGGLALFLINVTENSTAVDVEDYSYSVTADSILQEYESDEKLTHNKYYHENVLIFSEIESISILEDSVEITLVNTKSQILVSYNVILIFKDANELSEIENLRIGDYITVIGKVGRYKQDNLVYNLYIERCNYIQTT